MKQITISESDLRKVLAEVIREHLGELLKENYSAGPKRTFAKSLITLKEIATFYSVSLVTVYKWRKAGILPKEIKRGSRIYFNSEEVLQSIK